MSAAKIFISYSHKDELYREELEKHLTMLKRNGLVEIWTNRCIIAGKEWNKEINQKLKEADIILLLISPDFLASEYCYDIEVQNALNQHEEGISILIPVILRHCDWFDTPFGKIQSLPIDIRPVKDYIDIDKAFLKIITEIKKVILRFEDEKSNLKPIFLNGIEVGSKLLPTKLFRITLFGKTNVGKSAIINSLLGGNFSTVEVTPNLTNSLNIYRKNQWTIIETPGLIGNKLSKEIIVEEAKKADIFIFIVDGEPYDDEIKSFDFIYSQNLNMPIVVFINKEDIYLTYIENNSNPMRKYKLRFFIFGIGLVEE